MNPRTSLAFPIIASGVLLIGITRETSAQCPPQWLKGPGDPGWGFANSVFAMAQDQDHLYIGGIGPGDDWPIFHRWDGFAWESLVFKSGINIASIVVMQPYKGDLILGGVMWNGTAPGIARWDGTIGHPMGTGLTGVIVPVALAMVEFEDSLIVGGRFTAAGGVPAINVARWDGAQWHAMSGGLGTPELPYVSGLCVHEGTLFAGLHGVDGGPGNMGIGRWTGSGWESLELPLTDTERVYKTRVASHNGQLFVAGQIAEFPNWTKQAARSYRHNGTKWTLLHSVDQGSVIDLRTINDELYLLGSDGTGVDGNNLARWNGTAWVPLVPGVAAGGTAIAPFGDGLIIAGSVKDQPALGPFPRFACVCPADCDASSSLDIRDFVCFQTLFALGDDAADCDGDGALTIDDFLCFQSAYAAGC
jgi:hypothetical protein